MKKYKTQMHIIIICKGHDELYSVIEKMEAYNYVVAGISEDPIQNFTVVFRKMRL